MNSSDSDRRNGLSFFGRRLTKRQRLTTWLAGGGGLGLLIVAVVWAGPAFASRETSGVVGPRRLPVQTLRIVAADGYSFDRDYAGEVVARRAASIGFELSGRLVRLQVDEGDRVDAGDVLAVIDTRNTIAQRDAQRSELASARARLEELRRGPRAEVIARARAEVQRTEAEHSNWTRKLAKRSELFERGVAAEEEYDDAVYATRAAAAALEAARQRLAELENGTRPEQIAAQQALVEQLEAALRNTEILLDKSTLRAPFGGQVARRTMDEGQVVAPGTTIFRIVEDDALEARVGVPGRLAGRFRTGDQHVLRVGSLELAGTVRAVLPEVDASTRTVTVVFTLHADAATTRPRPGQIARLAWPTPVAGDGFWLPLPALTKGSRGLWSCFVADAEATDGTARIERRAVEVLHVDNERAYVRGVLRDGERVVAAGVERIVPGQIVELAD